MFSFDIFIAHLIIQKIIFVFSISQHYFFFLGLEKKKNRKTFVRTTTTQPKKYGKYVQVSLKFVMTRKKKSDNMKKKEKFEIKKKEAFSPPKLESFVHNKKNTTTTINEAKINLIVYLLSNRFYTSRLIE